MVRHFQKSCQKGKLLTLGFFSLCIHFPLKTAKSSKKHAIFALKKTPKFLTCHLLPLHKQLLTNNHSPQNITLSRWLGGTKYLFWGRNEGVTVFREKLVGSEFFWDCDPRWWRLIKFRRTSSDVTQFAGLFVAYLFPWLSRPFGSVLVKKHVLVGLKAKNHAFWGLRRKYRNVCHPPSGTADRPFEPP